MKDRLKVTRAFGITITTKRTFMLHDRSNSNFIYFVITHNPKTMHTII
jgi:hypothetical protein